LLVAEPVEKPPTAVQLVALVELQVRVVDWPLRMVEGVAASVAVGASETVTVGPPVSNLHFATIGAS
jgi:hypothetical protein